jgi:hypothetical protein
VTDHCLVHGDTLCLSRTADLDYWLGDPSDYDMDDQVLPRIL